MREQELHVSASLIKPLRLVVSQISLCTFSLFMKKKKIPARATHNARNLLAIFLNFFSIESFWKEVGNRSLNLWRVYNARKCSLYIVLWFRRRKINCHKYYWHTLYQVILAVPAELSEFEDGFIVLSPIDIRRKWKTSKCIFSMWYYF